MTARGLRDPDRLAERFAAELERVGGTAHRLSGADEAAPRVVEILRGAGLSGTVLRWDDPGLAHLDPALQAAGYGVHPFRGDLAEAERACAGITGCRAAIAETGTLVLASPGRCVSLLPMLHIALVQKEQIVGSAAEVLARLAREPMPSQVVFVTGPSRSADIENDLSIGVHGPGKLHVLIF